LAVADTDLSHELDEERRLLEIARDCLTRMRERTEQITDTARDELTAFALGRTKAQRIAALTIPPDVPLFFGRLDLDAGSAQAGSAQAGSAQAGEAVHVGRRHIRDDEGDPVVVDWRAPLAVPFYRASPTAPLGVRRRRRFGFRGGQLTSFEDEPLAAGTATAGTSELLLAEIERPRVGPMRDVVATIQPDQDELVRSPLERSLCVQGAPGTGKTAVGLHRAAYLLYTYRERLNRSGVLVIGPNAAFLRYIAGVLPALGEVAVTQLTVAELTAMVPVRGVDEPAVAALKGDPRLATVLANAATLLTTEPTTSLVVPLGARRYRIGSYDLRAELTALRDDPALRYGTGRDRLGMVLAHRVRRLAEEEGASPSDAATERLARTGPIRAFVDHHWPALDPLLLLSRLYLAPDVLAAAAEGVLSAAEQDLLRWPAPPRSLKLAPWTAADTVLLDELAGMLERPASYGHIVLDEAQDLSPMQYRAVGRRCPTGSVTALGDLAQGTAPWAARDWDSAMAGLGKPGAAIAYLTTGYRVPGEVMALANRLLPHLDVAVPPGRALRSDRGTLAVRPVPAAPGALAAAVLAAIEGTAEGSIGVITPDASAAGLAAALTAAGVALTPPEHPEAAERVSVLAAGTCKGLEFDHVILVEPAAIAAGGIPGLRLLYVALTRAVSQLTVLHQQPLPAQLLR
jgi:DNA helicase IV